MTNHKDQGVQDSPLGQTSTGARTEVALDPASLHSHGETLQEIDLLEARSVFGMPGQARPPVPTAVAPLGGLVFDSRRRVADDSDLATATILIVDQNDLNRRLVKGVLKASRYQILEATRPSDALKLLETEEIDLVVVELMMPEMSGTQFCQILKAQRRTQLIPILMISSVQGMESEVAGLESGADEFLLKPLKPTVVRTRVRALLRGKALIDSLEEAETILFALAQAVEHRDHYTGLHCERLAAYSVRLGQALGLPHGDQLALFRGGYLHDIGKITIPDRILYKESKLNPQEWDLMRLHTVRGEEICKPMKSLKPVLPIIRGHHERWDGGGYPDGLAGEDIPLLARIMQVADIYDALTTSRPYKRAYSHHEAVNTMMEEVAAGWRDPELVQLFAEITKPESDQALADWSDADQMLASLENMRRQLAR